MWLKNDVQVKIQSKIRINPFKEIWNPNLKILATSTFCRLFFGTRHHSVVHWVYMWWIKIWELFRLWNVLDDLTGNILINHNPSSLIKIWICQQKPVIYKSRGWESYLKYLKDVFRRCLKQILDVIFLSITVKLQYM